MSVETFAPANARITMTEEAAQQARDHLASSDAVGLKLDITTSGCSGYMYIMDYVTQPAEHDRAFQVSGGVTVYVSEEALPLLNGTEIDWVTEGVNSFFKFRNPNVEDACGCGESIKFKDVEELSAEQGHG